MCAPAARRLSGGRRGPPLLCGTENSLSFACAQQPLTVAVPSVLRTSPHFMGSHPQRGSLFRSLQLDLQTLCRDRPPGRSAVSLLAESLHRHSAVPLPLGKGGCVGAIHESPTARRFISPSVTCGDSSLVRGSFCRGVPMRSLAVILLCGTDKSVPYN